MQSVGGDERRGGPADDVDGQPHVLIETEQGFAGLPGVPGLSKTPNLGDAVYLKQAGEVGPRAVERRAGLGRRAREQDDQTGCSRVGAGVNVGAAGSLKNGL